MSFQEFLQKKMSHAFLLQLSSITHVLFVTPNNPGWFCSPTLSSIASRTHHQLHCYLSVVLISTLKSFFMQYFLLDKWVYFIRPLSLLEAESHKLYKQVRRRDLLCPEAYPSFLTLSNTDTASDKLCPLTSLIIVAKSPQFLPQHTPPTVIT